MTYWLYAPTRQTYRLKTFWQRIRTLESVREGDEVFVFNAQVVECLYDVSPYRDKTGLKTDYNSHRLIFEQPLPRMAIVDNFYIRQALQLSEFNNVPIELPGEAAAWLLTKSLELVELESIGPYPDGSGAGLEAIQTEGIRLRRERLVQSLFRSRLMTRWGGKCAVTGLDDSLFLRASHIKPWATASDFERLDQDNGLLLAINYDFAFDRGLVGFDNSGLISVHPKANVSGLKLLGINEGVRLVGEMNKKQQDYLFYHRQFVFGSFSDQSNDVEPIEMGVE